MSDRDPLRGSSLDPRHLYGYCPACEEVRAVDPMPANDRILRPCVYCGGPLDPNPLGKRPPRLSREVRRQRRAFDPVELLGGSGE